MLCQPRFVRQGQVNNNYKTFWFDCLVHNETPKLILIKFTTESLKSDERHSNNILKP